MVPEPTTQVMTDAGAEASATTNSTPSASPPPRPSVRWWMLVIAIAASITLFVLGVVYSGPSRDAVQRTLRGIEGSHAHAEEDEQNLHWTCGMHPWVILPSPEGGCPLCGMDLVPLDLDEFTGQLEIDPTIVQNIGVRIGPVTTGARDEQLRTVGSIAVNERALYDVNTRFSGWIEDLEVDETGQQVERGDVLFTVYSPDLYAAVEEFRLAQAGARRSTTGPAADVQQELLAAAEQKLELLGLDQQEIAALSDEAAPRGTVAIRSPISGTVLEKAATQGMQVEPGMRVYRIADLSTVWVEAAVYEDQLPFVEVGQRATMTLSHRPGEEFEGEVRFISPVLDPQSRQGTVRLEFPNEQGRLKPGMFAQVQLHYGVANQLTLVPREAVLDAGRRAMVMVSLGEGRFEPRDVTLGASAGGGLVEILEGLEPGEMVVTSGQFLLDSEARMREGLAKMLRGEQAADQVPVVPVAETQTDSLPGDVAGVLSELLRAYLSSGEALATDSVEHVGHNAQAIAGAAERLESAGLPKAGDVATAAADLGDKSGEIEAARVAFKALSEEVAALVSETGVPASFDADLMIAVCPMFPEMGQDSPWVQPVGEIRNPYYGSAMLTCERRDDRRRLPSVPVADAHEEEQP